MYINCTFFISGRYLFIESSSPRVPGDKARISSELFQNTTVNCLNFWYHMYGLSVGSLNVYMVTSTSNMTLWTMTGNQADQWHSAQVGFKSNTPYSVSEAFIFYAQDTTYSNPISAFNCLSVRLCLNQNSVIIFWISLKFQKIMSKHHRKMWLAEPTGLKLRVYDNT